MFFDDKRSKLKFFFIFCENLFVVCEIKIIFSFNYGLFSKLETAKIFVHILLFVLDFRFVDGTSSLVGYKDFISLSGEEC